MTNNQTRSELRRLIYDLENDINHIINISNKDGIIVPDWIYSNIKTLQLNYRYLQRELLKELEEPK